MSESEPPPPEPPPLAAKARDLDALRAAVLDAATVGAGLWLSYLFVLFYLIIAVGSVTHRDLLLQSPIRLPFLSTDLPLRGFFALGPLIFLIVHAYVLLHFVLLADKVGVFHSELQAQILDDDIRVRLRRQLPSNIFVQYLAGPGEVRYGVMGFLLRLIAQISLVVAPLALLLFFQFQFLPYHDEAVTLWQRAALVLDLVLLWLMWPAIARGETIGAAWRGMRPSRLLLPGIGSAFLLALAFLVATFPGEWLDEKFYAGRDRDRIIAWPHQVLFEGIVNPASRRPVSLWSNVLVLPGLNTEAASSASGAPPLSLRLRHLEGAVLIGADLRKVDLTGANLRGAKLNSADLRGTDFGCDLRELTQSGESGEPGRFCTSLEEANLEGANLSAAQLPRANLQGARLLYAYMSDAMLAEANLQDAEISYALLDGATLIGAKLDGAILDATKMRGAQLVGASMIGAQLQAAFLQGATLDEAKLDGADLSGVWLQAASLRRARLIAASLYGADLRGALLEQAELLGARMDVANLDGASLDGIVVWLATPPNRPPGEARVVALRTRPQVYETRARALEPVLRDWSAEDYAALAASAKDFRTGTVAELATQRIAKLDPSLHPEQDPPNVQAWKNLQDGSPSPDEYRQKLTEVLRATACAPEGAPYVAAAVIRQINPRHTDAKLLATALLDPAKCPGARGLPEDQQQYLRSMLGPS
jgi:uncharacterized protein YjbI with pentapeptide repeats